MNFQYDKELHLLRGTYNEDFDIERFHEIVCKIIRAHTNVNFVDLINEGIEDFSTPKNFNTRVQLFSNIIGKIADINTDLTYYITKATPWIKAIKTNSGFKKTTLIECYFKMVSTYINLDIKHVDREDNEYLCIDCSSNIDPDDEICKICGSVQMKFISSTSYNQIDTSAAPKPAKTSLSKFWEKYLRYQGRLDVDINSNDIESIKNYINSNYSVLTLTEEYRSQNLSILRNALISLSLGKYKDDINIILNMIWNYDIPNFSQFDNVIEQRWTEGTEIINQNKQETELQNITHNEWRLYRELTDLGINCDSDDFQITNNKEIRRKMEDLWKARCKGMGRPYKPL